MEEKSNLSAVFWLGTTIMLFLAFGLIFLFLFYQNRLVKLKEKEAKSILKVALESEKQERQRIASDLHDSVQGDLNAIRNYFLLLVRSIPDYDDQELLDAIKNALEQTAENTRQISYKLMPPLLERAGFIISVTEYLEHLSKATGKSFSMQSNPDSLPLSLDVSYELFRIVQELTQNMLKYGAIQECRLFAYADEGAIHIEIVDDGTPYNFKDSLARSKGLGLRSISSRLAFIGAELIQREVAFGNHLEICLKIKP